MAKKIAPFRIESDVAEDGFRPLADRLRPESLFEVVGQSHLLGKDGPIGSMLEAGQLHSIILWGPPGSGKTTIARLLSSSAGREFVQISAVFSNVRELREIFDHAVKLRLGGVGTTLFVDEIHRFNKAQQDGFLPYMEDGTIALVGSTTENPSFELNSALLSRAKVVILNRLDHTSMEVLAGRAEAHLNKPLPLTGDARALLFEMADGDGRALLNMIEQLFTLSVSDPLGPKALMRHTSKRSTAYDKSSDWHYNLISALHKSVRGSDPDASLYWLARILEAGEDPRFVARRVTRMAVEDVGLADPNALELCISAWNAYERLGSPEGELAIAQVVLYLALAPKSNAAYRAYKSAVSAASSSGSNPPPNHILNAPTRLMKDIGYGKDYAYDHDTRHGFSGQNYFPDGMTRMRFYYPVERGFERDMKKRIEYFAKLREQLQASRQKN